MQAQDEATSVMRTAALMDISEFAVFDAAYREWHGEPTTERELEKHFVPYMFHGEVPLWVRHFTRASLEGNTATAAAHGSSDAAAPILAEGVAHLLAFTLPGLALRHAWDLSNASAALLAA